MVHIDWDAGHGPVTGPLNAAGASLALAYAGNAAHLGPQWVAAAAGAGLLGSMFTGARKRVPGAALAMRAATWLGVGGWCSWTVAEGPWTQQALGVLAAGAVGLGLAIEGVRHHEEVKADEQARAEAIERAASMDAKRRKVADEWTERLQRVCTGTRVQIVGVEQWESGGGVTLDGECEGGTKWKDFASFQDALAADAKLPEGCGVEVGPGAHRGAVLLHVSTRNFLIDDVPYPSTYQATSINEFSAIGVHRDGTPAGAVMRQFTSLHVGQKGSGKTNLMNVRLANQCQQVDNLPWVIDLNGGGLALPWLHAWYEAGRPGRPPIDWVADSKEEALEMARAALRIAKARKPGYKKREIAANDDKLPVDAEVPAITMNNDEVAELFSPKARRDPILRELGDTIVQIVELARAVAVNVDNAALRATQDVLSEPQLLKQAGFRVGMRVTDQAELNYLFGWDAKVTPEDAPYPGCGFVKSGVDPARPFKAFRLQPQQIAEIVKATAGLRPELDELSRRAAGEAYERRWENKDHLFGIGDAPALVGGQEDSVYEQPKRRGVTADWGTPAAPPAAPDAQSVIDQADAAKRDLHDAMRENGNHDADLDRQFQEIIKAAGGIWTPPVDDAVPAAATDLNLPTPGISSDPRWQQVYTIVRQAGPDGTTPDAIVETFRAVFPQLDAPSRQTITTWLKAEPRIAQPGGPRTNYIHTDHLKEQ